MNSATKFGGIALGSGITGVVIGLLAANSLVTRGNIVYDTVENTAPKIQVTQNNQLTTLIEFESGSTVTKFKGRTIGSGGLVELNGTLTLSEVNHYASGSLSIPNPIAYPLLCQSFVIDVQTSSGTVAKIDVYAGSGATGTMGLNGTGSVQIMNNITLTAYSTFTGTGTGVVDSAGYPKAFRLYPTTDNSKPNTINIVSDVQTGALLSARYFAECYLND